MADNYLEKKYEEYKSRKEGRTNHPYNGRKTTVIHKTRRVFVTGKRQRCRPEPLFSLLT